jgi:hypothetical protein
VLTLTRTGSRDSSVRLWNIEKLSSGKLEHIFTFVGHAGIVLCVDICPEYHIGVSAASDYSVYCWDYLSGKLLRSLEGHENPVVSISIGSLSGCICTLTKSYLRAFSVNGDLLVAACYTGGVVGDASISIGRVVLAPRCADWQDGITAVTGHDTGQVIMWRVRCDAEGAVGVNAEEDDRSFEPPSFSLEQCGSPTSPLSTRSRSSSISPASTPRPDRSQASRTILRRKFVPFMLAKTHRSQISVLRNCSHSTHTASRRDLIDKSFENAGAIELYIGDMDGYVSRWNAAQLTQFSPTELVSMFHKKGQQNSFGRNRAETVNSATSSSSSSGRMSSNINNITRSASLILGSNSRVVNISSARDSPSGSDVGDSADLNTSS